MKALLPCLMVTMLLCPVSAVRADPPPGKSGDLYRAIAAADAAAFGAFNRCELDKFSAYFTDDVEFYHDRDGLSLGKVKVLESTRMNVCGKMTRELVPESLEVYPLPGYGALEIGTHRFHHTGHDDSEPVGQGKFVHIWKNTNGQWQMTRVISYDHGEAPK
jgi:ketosteroid isomerase-like protein